MFLLKFLQLSKINNCWLTIKINGWLTIKINDWLTIKKKNVDKIMLAILNETSQNHKMTIFLDKSISYLIMAID